MKEFGVVTIKLTEQEAFDLFCAISCKIVQNRRYIETLSRLQNSGIDCADDIAREENQIRKLERLSSKIFC